MTRGQRWMAGALAAIAVVSIAAVVVWSARAGIARWLLVRQIEALTGRPASIGRVDVDLAHGRLVVAGLRVDDREPGPPLAELDRLDVRVDLRALLGRHVLIREATLGGVRVRIVRSERGTFNVADLLKRGENRAGSQAITIDRLALRDGAVSLEDRARAPARTWRAESIALELTGVSTQRQDAHGTGRLTATVAGAPVTMDVAELRLDPLHLRARLETRDLDATLASVTLPPDVASALEQARLSADVAASLDARDGVQLDIRGRLTDLAMRSGRTGDPLLTVPSLAFTVDGASMDASGATPRLGRIEVTGAATLFDARGEAAGRLGIDEIRLMIESDGGPPPAAARMTLTAALTGGGGLDVQGPVRLAPLGAELRVRMTGLSPTVLASHAALPVSLGGALDADLGVDLAGPVDRGPPESGASAVVARVRGRVTVNRAVAAGGGQQVAIARQVEIDGIDAEWPRIGIARVRVTQPVAVVERDRTGRIPVAALLTASRAPAATDPAAPGSTPAPSTAMTVEIGEIAVDDGTLTLDDATAVPAARLTLSRWRMSVRDAAWPPRGPMPIAVNAVTPGAGTLDATGTMSLDPLRLDVRARVAGAALAPYQGYVPFRARLEGQLHADLAVAGTLAPRTDVTAKGTAAVGDLSMADGDRPVLGVARIETAGLQYTWPSTLTVDRLHVRGSRLRAVRSADGTFPLRAIFSVAQESGNSVNPRPSARDAAPSQISVLVRDALLEDSRAQLIDEAVTPATSVDLTGVRLAAKGFSWPARDPLPIDFRMTTPGGGSVQARGTLDLAGAGADLKLTLSAVDVSPAQAYLPVSGRIGGKASADLDVKAKLEPLAIAARGTASLADVALADGQRPAITAARVETTGVDYAWPGKVAIDRLRVQTPRVVVRRRSNGSLPILDLLAGSRQASDTAPARSVAAAAPGDPSTSVLEISVKESVLEDAAVTVSDATVNPTARLELTGMRLTARDMTWPSRGPIPIDLRASMPGGGAASATGQLAQGLGRLDLDVTLTGVDVAVARPYLPIRGRMSGKASAKLTVDATFSPLAIAARGTASLADLVVADGERQLLTAGQTEATGLDYAWPSTVTIDQLHVRKSWALIDRVAGNLPVLDALSTVSPPAPTAGGRRGARSRNAGAPRPDRPAPRAESSVGRSDVSTLGQAPAVQMAIRETVIEDSGTSIVDASANPPARLEIVGARVVLRDVAWPAKGPTDLSLRASTPGAGAIEARGQLRLDAPAIDTRLVLEGVDVAALQPLIPLRARAGGKATADLQIKGTLVPLALTATGTAAVANVELGDGQRALVKATRVELTGLTAEWPRRRATVQRIAVSEPWALVEREAGGELPLLALLSLAPASTDGPRPAAAPVRAAAAPLDEAPWVQVGALAIEDGFVRFTDRTTRPAFVEEASRLTVTARGLSTEPSTRSEVVVNARLTGGAQVELRGVMGPIGGPLFADAQGQLSNLALNRVNPYVNGLLGWVARRGSVSATTRFRIRDDRLEADNDVVIGQPMFVPSRSGDEVRERVGVPLDLLVSLLENSRREVRLSVPVTGNLSSREFDFGDAVWDAIRKAAINVLALPVSWIGKIFYTADSRIDTIAIWPVYFEAGTTRFDKGVDAHAERLAGFMRQTPSIIYALKPVMTVADVQALKRGAVRQRIEALARESGGSDTAAAAAKLFAERFPERPAPAGLEATLDALAQDEPSPDAALRALAADRLAVTRRELESKGVDGTRLRTNDATVPVEASGAGRVEFEMIPDAAEAVSRG